MNIKNPTVQLILVSILTALAILLASAAFEGPAETLIYVIIAVWWIPYSILSVRQSQQSEEGSHESELS